MPRHETMDERNPLAGGFDTRESTAEEISLPLNETLKSLDSLRADLAEKKSPEASKWFLEQIGLVCLEASRSPEGKINRRTLTDLIEAVEKIPDLDEVQEKAFEVLDQLGIISFSPDEEIIVRLEKLREIDSKSAIKLGPVFSSQFYGQKKILPTLYYLFKDRLVISEEDYLSDIQEAKPLFYSPKNEEEAFDIEKIKEADFYLGLWEATNIVYSGSKYPSGETGADLDYSEVAIACKIYHPKYGNGFREESGRLKIFDQESKKYLPPSYDRLFRGSLGLAVDSQARPSEYVAKHFPNLNRNGLLTPEDFEVKPGLGTERPYYVQRKLDLYGSVMIDNIKYYISKSKEFRSAEIYKLSEDIAVVVLDGRITHTFQLLKPGDPKLKLNSTTKSGLVYYRANREETNLKEFDHGDFFEKDESETEQEFEERTVPVENFELWQALEKVLGPENMLTAFRSAELDAREARSVLELIGQLTDEEVEQLVQKYREVVKSVREVGNFIKNNLESGSGSAKLIEKIVRKSMRRSLDVLLRQSKEPEVSVNDLIERLDALKSEVNLFAPTYKSLCEEGQKINLEDFAKFQFEEASGKQISPADADEMKTIIIKNRLDRPEVIEQATSEFEKALQNSDSKFFILKYDGELIGFFRVDSLGDLDAHVGSFNVSPSIQGSGIGDEVLNKYLIQALAGKIGHADADPKNWITHKYIGRYNFIGQSIEKYGDTGRPYIKLLLNPHLNSELKSLNLSDEEIASSFRSNEYKIGDTLIITRFLETEIDKSLAATNEVLSSGKYVLTAYRAIAENDQKFIYSVFESVREKKRTNELAA